VLCRRLVITNKSVSCSELRINKFILFNLFYRGKDAYGIIMKVCPSASAHYRHHSHDIFKEVRNFYDTWFERHACQDHSTFVFFSSSNNSVTAVRNSDMGHLTLGSIKSLQ
jgi:hypothetical protein